MVNVINRLFRVGIILSSFWMAAGFLIAQTSELREQAAQTPATGLTADQLTAAAKRYFHDTAELPLLQQTEFSVFDRSGRVRKREKSTRDYLFEGYNPRSETAHSTVSGGNVSFWSMMRGNKMLKISGNSAIWTMHAGGVARNLNGFTFEADTLPGSDGWMLAKLVPKGPCHSVVMNKNAEYYLLDGEFCLSAELQLDHELRFQKGSYEVMGLPAAVKIHPFGECTLTRYHAEVEFQMATMPGDKEPFLIPKRVTTTLQTNKGNVVISSVYELKPPVR
jgi:hypothetical protein